MLHLTAAVAVQFLYHCQQEHIRVVLLRQGREGAQSLDGSGNVIKVKRQIHSHLNATLAHHPPT